MSIKKIAAQYELMKIADAFQALVKKFAQEAQESQVIPEQSSVSVMSHEASALIEEAFIKAVSEVESRYEKDYTPQGPRGIGGGNRVLKLKPQYANQYKTPPTHWDADPYMPHGVRGFSANAILWTANGKLWYPNKQQVDSEKESAIKGIVTRYLQDPNKIVVTFKVRVHDPAVMTNNLDINKMKNTIAAQATKSLMKEGKLSSGNVVPANLVSVQIIPIR